MPKSVSAWNKSVIGVDVLDQGSAEASPSRKGMASSIGTNQRFKLAPAYAPSSSW